MPLLLHKDGGRGKTPPTNKMNVEKLKSDKNNWNFFVL